MVVSEKFFDLGLLVFVVNLIWDVVGFIILDVCVVIENVVNVCVGVVLVIYWYMGILFFCNRKCVGRFLVFIFLGFNWYMSNLFNLKGIVVFFYEFGLLEEVLVNLNLNNI